MTPRTLRARLEQRDLMELVDPICKRHMVIIEDLDTPRGSEAVCEARQEIYDALYATGHWSYPRLGLLFERDQASIRYGVRKAAARRAEKGTVAA